MWLAVVSWSLCPHIQTARRRDGARVLSQHGGQLADQTHRGRLGMVLPELPMSLELGPLSKAELDINFLVLSF